MLQRRQTAVIHTKADKHRIRRVRNHGTIQTIQSVLGLPTAHCRIDIFRIVTAVFFRQAVKYHLRPNICVRSITHKATGITAYRNRIPIEKNFRSFVILQLLNRTCKRFLLRLRSRQILRTRMIDGR